MALVGQSCWDQAQHIRAALGIKLITLCLHFWALSQNPGPLLYAGFSVGLEKAMPTGARDLFLTQCSGDQAEWPGHRSEWRTWAFYKYGVLSAQ